MILPTHLYSGLEVGVFFFECMKHSALRAHRGCMARRQWLLPHLTAAPCDRWQNWQGAPKRKGFISDTPSTASQRSPEDPVDQRRGVRGLSGGGREREKGTKWGGENERRGQNGGERTGQEGTVRTGRGTNFQTWGLGGLDWLHPKMCIAGCCCRF
jgi:hypothetical protein